MAIEALGTPVVVSACLTMASTCSRRAEEIGACACARRSEVASKIKIKTARRLPGRGRGFMHLSWEPEQDTALGWHFCRLALLSSNPESPRPQAAAELRSAWTLRLRSGQAREGAR